MGLYGNLWGTENESGTVTLWATADGAQKMEKRYNNTPLSANVAFPALRGAPPVPGGTRSRGKCGQGVGGRGGSPHTVSRTFLNDPWGEVEPPTAEKAAGWKKAAGWHPPLHRPLIKSFE